MSFFSTHLRLPTREIFRQIFSLGVSNDFCHSLHVLLLLSVNIVAELNNFPLGYFFLSVSYSSECLCIRVVPMIKTLTFHLLICMSHTDHEFCDLILYRVFGDFDNYCLVVYSEIYGIFYPLRDETSSL